MPSVNSSRSGLKRQASEESATRPPKRRNLKHSASDYNKFRRSILLSRVSRALESTPGSIPRHNPEDVNVADFDTCFDYVVGEVNYLMEQFARGGQ